MHWPAPSPRASLRAALLAVALGVHGLAAFPSPKKISRAQFDHPVAVEEVDRWVEVLAGLGVETTRAAVVDGVVSIGGRAVAVRTAVLGPAQPVFMLTGTGQGWGLFAYPDSYPDRLVVDGLGADGQWRPLFRALEADHDFLAPQLSYRRVRGVYDGHTERPRQPYENLVQWIAAQALHADPALSAVRVLFERSHTLPPTAPQDPVVKRRLKRIVAREPAP